MEELTLARTNANVGTTTHSNAAESEGCFVVNDKRHQELTFYRRSRFGKQQTARGKGCNAGPDVESGFLKN